MESLKTVYTQETINERLSLNDAQKEAVRAITLGIEEVDETIRSMAVDDVIQTLENGNPLNRIITDQKGATMGYIACEDFIPHEAYIKYFGTSDGTGRNLLRELPAFLEYAKAHGYVGLNFHGWNDRLNHILERYGFQRMRTDTIAGYAVDFYEKMLGPQKTSEEIERERREAFERKYINKINQEYQQTRATFSDTTREEKGRSIDSTFATLDRRLAGVEWPEGVAYGERQQAILKLKLARYFQKNDSCDLSTLYDAIVESPRFIHTDKGSLYRLLEVHQEKTTQKIAETRKARAEMGDSAAFNPYEALFTTSSGNYYMARLLNMPHLEKESEYMNNCVGTSNSYVNRIKKGEIEILSFRRVPTINPKTKKLEGDTPVMTIEYNLKTNTIQQMKKHDDKYLDKNDPFFRDIVEALKTLRTTKNDAGAVRDFKTIASSELGNITVQDHHLLTDHGEVHFRDFDPDSGTFILKMGLIEIVKGTSKADAVTLLKIVDGIEYAQDHIAIGQDEITSRTTAYIGPFFPSIFKDHPHIEQIYTSFPEGKVFIPPLEVSVKDVQKTGEEMANDIVEVHGIDVSDSSQHMLTKGKRIKDGKTFEQVRLERLEELKKLGKPETIHLVRLTVNDMFGDGKNHTTAEIYKKAADLGLELCPPEVGPLYRIAYKDQPQGEYLHIAMEQITGSGGRPSVFSLVRGGRDVWLDGRWARPDAGWFPGPSFVFRLRK